MWEASIHGFLLALGLILPLGAQNLFIFTQGAYQTRLIRALPSVITAAVCDTLMVALAVLGISVVVFKFVWLQTMLFGMGSVFLLYMGWAIWNRGPSNGQAGEAKLYSARKQVVLAVSASLLNPHAILDMIAVIGMNSLRYSGMEKVAFTGAVISVSWLWFIGLAVAGRMLGRLDPTGSWMRTINKCSAVLIWGTVLYMGWQLLR
ncbi:LysE/ArgO family amino acid transporter [Paenibacillus rigui]|uniref:Lysine transporter LysE n=1 Tax=Paenibacillus rigui TaxID=554312 RepID=A0A229UJH9_9BACL|nr:LysE family transporter [Paenibacillus rigui]OXM83455.1 lysine transporter LysE [Paenibacillus rigui]